MSPRATDLAPVAAALKRLARSEGRIARRNARRAAFGALRSVRGAIDREYPAIEKPTGAPDPLARIANKTWRQVEYGIVKPGRYAFDRSRAEAFNAHASELDGHPAKPIRFDLSGRLVGQHTRDAIRLQPLPVAATWRDAELWRTLLHEIAHYRVHRHGRAFRVELVRVYGMWRAWRGAAQ